MSIHQGFLAEISGQLPNLGLSNPTTQSATTQSEPKAAASPKKLAPRADTSPTSAPTDPTARVGFADQNHRRARANLQLAAAGKLGALPRNIQEKIFSQLGPTALQNMSDASPAFEGLVSST
jgi:hypothetical protein